MPKKSRFFRVAIEGATSDGHTIDRDWLLQIAKSYDPKVYGARINMEHIRGYGPNSDFRAYGDVLAVKTEEVDSGFVFGVPALVLLMQHWPGVFEAGMRLATMAALPSILGFFIITGWCWWSAPSLARGSWRASSSGSSAVKGRPSPKWRTSCATTLQATAQQAAREVRNERRHLHQ